MPYSERSRHRRQQEALVTLTRADALSGDDLDTAFRRITEADAEALLVARSSIWRYTSDRSAMVCLDLYDREAGSHASGMELRAADFPSYFASLSSREVVDAADALRDPRTREFSESHLMPLGVTSMMHTPFHASGVVEGVVCRGHIGPVREWTDDEKTFGVAVANLVSLTLTGWEHRRAEGLSRLLGAAFDAAAHGMVITDRNGAIEWVNPAFARTTGYSFEEAVGRNPRDLVKSGLHDQAYYARLWQTVLDGKVWQGEMTNRRKDGTLYPLELIVTPIRDSDGSVGHFIAVQRDLTEQKRLEAQFLQAQKHEVLGRLVGGIAHDFNNLLTVINGTADVVAMGLDKAHPIRADLDHIQQAGRRAAALTRQLLTFSRRQAPEAEILDLGEMLDGWRGMLQRLIGETIALDLARPDRVSAVKADPGQIEQVIMNLAINARDAMPDGGWLTVEVRDETVERGARLQPPVEPGRFVVLSVADTGVGMDAETLERMYEPFFTTKEPGKGTGLGLATVLGIVQRLGGGIHVKSERGRGSTFEVYLPAHGEKPREVAQDAASIARGPETIVVVEDEEALRKLATRILTSAGYTVLAAAHPHEALEAVRAHQGPIHLLLTDVILPGTNGRELARRIHEMRPDIAVLFTSGYTDDEIVRHGVLEKAAQFIGKPYTAAALTQKIRALLDSA